MGVYGSRTVQHWPCRPAVRHICAVLCALPITYRIPTVPREHPRAAGGSPLGVSSAATVCHRQWSGTPFRQRDCNRHGQGSCRKVSDHQRPRTGCPCSPCGIYFGTNVCCTGFGSSHTPTDVCSALLAQRRYATAPTWGMVAPGLTHFGSARGRQLAAGRFGRRPSMVATQAHCNSRTRYRGRGSDRRIGRRADVVPKWRRQPSAVGWITVEHDVDQPQHA